MRERAGSRPWRRARRARGALAARGFTLMELMLVIALISLVLGVGLGMFASLRPGERAAVGLVQSTLRRASLSALHHNASARVVLAPGGATMRAEALRVIGTWHFEDQGLVRGAFGLDGSFDEGGRVVDGGWQGRALSFAGEGSRARVAIAVQGDPAWDLERGFVLELAVRRETEHAAPLVAIGGTAVLECGARGELELALHGTTVDGQGVPRPGERVRVRASGALSLDRWQLVRAGYDRARAWIAVDGVELASVDTDVPLWEVDGSLVLGGGDRPFGGAIDALSVRAVESEEELTLPAGVLFAKNAPARVVFAPGGGLDPAFHPEPVVIELELADARRRSVRVETYGTVQ